MKNKQVQWVTLDQYNAKIAEFGKDVEYVPVMGEKNLGSGVTKKGLDIIYISKDIPKDPENPV